MRRKIQRASVPRRSDTVTPPMSAWGFFAEVLHTIQVWRATYQPPSPQQEGSTAKTTAEVFYEAMVRRIELQVRVSEAYDTKIAAWFALSTLVISISATALAAEHTLLKRASIVLALIGTAFWLLAIIASFLCFQQSDLDAGPTEEDYGKLASDPAFSTTDMHLFIAQFIATQSIPKNQRLLGRKALWFTFAVGLSMVEFYLLCGSRIHHAQALAGLQRRGACPDRAITVEREGFVALFRDRLLRRICDGLAVRSPIFGDRDLHRVAVLLLDLDHRRPPYHTLQVISYITSIARYRAQPFVTPADRRPRPSAGRRPAGCRARASGRRGSPARHGRRRRPPAS
jgi:hypothetical protein